MFTCGKCRLEGVAEAKRCTTVESARAHYAGKPVVKRSRKVQPKG
jgi:hypothetical protein